MEKRVAALLGFLGVSAALFVFSRTDTGALAIGNIVDGIARGVRNNNPGNIDWIETPSKRWRGMIGRDGRFGVFDTAANGVRAIGGELRASIKKGHTVEAAIHEWAPPVENNTAAYVDHVTDDTGFPANRLITTSMIPAIAEAIIAHENGYNPYSRADIARWVNLA